MRNVLAALLLSVLAAGCSSAKHYGKGESRKDVFCVAPVETTSTLTAPQGRELLELAWRPASQLDDSALLQAALAKTDELPIAVQTRGKWKLTSLEVSGSGESRGRTFTIDLDAGDLEIRSKLELRAAPPKEHSAGWERVVSFTSAIEFEVQAKAKKDSDAAAKICEALLDGLVDAAIAPLLSGATGYTFTQPSSGRWLYQNARSFETHFGQ